jgi:uncharacterized membrane protein
MQVIDHSAGAAIAWIKESWLIFRGQAGPWVALLAAWALFSMVIFLLPLIGPPLCYMLQPGLFAGMVIAARDQQNGQPVTPGLLFAGFRANGRPLVTIGSIALVAELLVMYAMSLLGFPAVPVASDGLPDFRAFSKLLEGKEVLIFIGLVLVMLIKGVLWFTSPLLALNVMGPGAAIRWSLFAFVANALPLALLCLIMSVLMFAAALPLGLGFPVWLPIYGLLHYVTYKNVFK